MGLFLKQRDRNYCRIPSRVTHCGGRYSSKHSKGCRQVEVKSQYILKDLQMHGNTGERLYYFSNLTSFTKWHLMETEALQPRERESETLFKIS